MTPTDSNSEEFKGTFSRFRIIILAASVLFVVIFLIVAKFSDRRRSELVKERLESERILTHTAQLIIGNEVEKDSTSLTLIDSLQVLSAGLRMKHGITRYVPNKIRTGAADSVAIPEPSINSITIDDQLFTDFSVIASGRWWGLKVGSESYELTAGMHRVQIVSQIQNQTLFAANGGGLISLPLIAPVALLKDSVEGVIILPDYARASSVKFSSAIRATDGKGGDLPDSEDVPGVQTEEQLGNNGPPRITLRFKPQRRLSVSEGLWVSVSW